jgi:multiple sugar transport system substrate-binding protein
LLGPPAAFWNDCYDPGGLAWDDSSNNRAFLAGTVSSTNNGASIYLEAKKKPETYLTEKGSPLWKRIELALAARGVVMERDRVAVGSRVSLRAAA